MKAKKVGLHPAARLQMGAAVLAAAKVVDVTAVKVRLAAFARAHRSFMEAHVAVDAADARLATAQVQGAEAEARQDKAVEVLACWRVHDGNIRRRPFAGIGPATPSAIQELPAPEKAKVVHRLAAAVQIDKTASPTTLRAARAAEQAAQALEAALVPLEQLEATLRTAREARDHIGRTWQAALSALKRSARAADDDGGPALSQALFGALRRPAKKAAAAPPAPASEVPAEPSAPKTAA